MGSFFVSSVRYDEGEVGRVFISGRKRLKSTSKSLDGEEGGNVCGTIKSASSKEDIGHVVN